MVKYQKAEGYEDILFICNMHPHILNKVLDMTKPRECRLANVIRECFT